MRGGQLGMRSRGRRGKYSFQRPPLLMRLTMLTRDKMSLLRAASLRTARETAHGLNDRKHRGWGEAGILRLSASFSGRAQKIETIILRCGPIFGRGQARS